MDIPELVSQHGSINEGKELECKDSWLICIYDSGNDSCGFVLIPEKECSKYKEILDRGYLNLREDETSREEILLADLFNKYGIKYGSCNIKSPSKVYGISILD